eukprot:109435_1
MAAQGITTAKLETSTFNFNQWVNENKLNEIKDLLRKHKMTNINSLRTTSAEYFKLMSDPALLAKGHALPRLMAALQKVPRNTTPPQVIRIMISKEEEDTVDKLRKYSSKLSDLQKEMELSSVVLNTNIDKCAEDIELLFNDLRSQFLYEFNNICAYKRGQIDDKLNAISGEKQRIEDALNQCDNLQNDTDLDRKKRCDEVMNIVNTVLSGNRVSHDTMTDIDTSIVSHHYFDKIKTYLLSVIRSMQLDNIGFNTAQYRASNVSTTGTQLAAQRNEEKKRIWGNGQYLMMIMRERKERYLAAYTKRLQRIYCTYQPSKLDKIDGWVAKYGVDVDKLHELYMKICSKYELEPCDKYDGSEHEKVPDDEENEKRAATAPVQSLSQNLNEDKTKEATTDTGKNGMATSSPWSVNTDSSKEAVDTTHSSTSNAQPVHVSFYDVPNPFASNSTTSTTKHFASSNNTKSKGWSFTLKSTASKDHNRNSGSTWNNKDGGSIGAVQFSIPTNMLFSSSNDEKDNDTKHEKDFFFISKKQTTKSRRRVIFKARRRCFE